MKKNYWLISSIVVAIVAIAVLIAIFYLYVSNNNSSVPKSMTLSGSGYIRNYSDCISSKSLASEGYIKMCTAVYNLETPMNNSGLLPNDFIFNTYYFVNSSSLGTFINSLKSDLNTTPWPDQTTSAYIIRNATYTTIYFPDYNNSNRTAVVIAEYVRVNDTVFGISTQAIMHSNANLTAWEKVLNSALLNLNKSLG